MALETGQLIELDAQAAVHLSKVLRLKSGDAVVLFNGEGGEFQACIEALERRSVRVRVGAFVARELESPLDLVLAQGISRGERMDYTVQKAVELGVSRIIPVDTERTGVNLKGDRQIKRRDHWQAVVNSACEQSGRNRVPVVEEVLGLAQWLGQAPEGFKLVLHHRATQGLSEGQQPQGRIILLIGPEGGLSEHEIELAQGVGFQPLCLGPRVMRTETASVAALSVLQWLWGDFSQ
jgi:16S rRNA (uracil1498-N3)-methyltransferase